MKINNDYLGTMKTALDAYSMRNESISSNLANVNTPNYKRKYLKSIILLILILSMKNC